MNADKRWIIAGVMPSRHPPGHCLMCGRRFPPGTRSHAQTCPKRRREDGTTQSTACRTRLHRLRRASRSQRIALYYGCKATDVWGTDPRVFEQLDREFQFVLDLAALPDDALCMHHIGPDENSLKVPWAARARRLAPERAHPSGFCNPPYSRGIGRWVDKAIAESREGFTTVLLLPPSSDAGWYHTAAQQGQVRVLPGRLAHRHPDSRELVANNRAGSVIVVIRPAHLRRIVGLVPFQLNAA